MSRSALASRPRRARRSSLSRGVLVGLAVSVAAACAPTEELRRVWDPAPSDVYPNRRPPLALRAGLVGIVSNSGSDSLTFVALPEGNVLADVPVGRDPVDIDGPHHLAVDPSSGVVYTALSYPTPPTSPGPHASHGVSERFGWVEKLSLTDLRPLGQVRVATNPGDVVLSDDGARLVVTHFDRSRAQSGKTLAEKRAELMLVDTKTLVGLPGQPIAPPTPKSAPVCVAPHGVALSPGGGDRAYVACYGEDALAIVDLRDPAMPVDRISFDGASQQPGAPTFGPYAAVLSSDGGLLAVACLESREVRIFEIAERRFRQGSLALQGAAFFPAWSADGATLYAPSQSPDVLVAFDVATGAPKRQRSFDAECTKPHEVVRSADSKDLYLVCEGDHVGSGALLVLDAETFETKSRTTVGVFPDRVVLFEAKPR